MFQIGDLVEDKWGDIGIIVRQIGVIDRWVVQYLTGDSALIGQWGSSLYHLESPEVDKKSEKK